MKSAVLTKNQTGVFERSRDFGELFFEGAGSGYGFSPRFFPLIAGPTGAGKTFLAGKLAADLKAHYMHLTYGDWLPLGVEDGRGGSTMYRMIDAVCKHERVVVHLDELDKLRVNFDTGWERSVCTEIWSLMDKKFPVADWLTARGGEEGGETTPVDLSAPRKDYFEDHPFDDCSIEDECFVGKLLQQRLWIIGSGTWQDIFEKEQKAGIGFETRPADDPDRTGSEIHAAKVIPAELLARFNADLLVLRYPTSSEEKLRLLQDSGVAELADRVGHELCPEALDFSKFGMRIVETLLCDLLLKERAIHRQGYSKSVPLLTIVR